MKNQTPPIEIALSKKKIILALLGCIAFVAFSVWFMLNPERFISSIFRSEKIIFIVGIIGAIFFGFIGIITAKKLTDKSKGLIISDEGIYDNSSAVAVGLREWKDITGVSKSQIMSTKFLIIKVSDPEKYIAKAKNKLAQNSLRMTLKSYGSPISIASTALEINFEELEKLVTERFLDYRN